MRRGAVRDARAGRDLRASRRHLTRRAARKGGHDPKVCASCGREYEWRRKWARDWPSVRYCSDRCRRAAG
ncbi:MAG: DUF2256 domain-containing protein [Ilumatobacteraceae bacterium]